MPDADENSFCNVEFDIGEVSFELEEDADGELRRLKGEIMVNVYSDCFTGKEIELVEDAYSPDARISLEKEQLKMEEIAAENKSQVTLRETIESDEEAPDISEVFNVLGKLSLSGSEMEDDRIVVEGIVECDILYLASNEEQPVICTTRELPFKHVVEMKGAKPGMRIELEMSIEHCSYSMLSAKEVEVRFVIGMLGRVSNQVNLPVIIKAVEQPLDDKRQAEQPSFTIYFTQPGDNLWKIAKRYCTTIENIKRDNEIGDQDVLIPGNQILIPRKV